MSDQNCALKSRENERCVFWGIEDNANSAFVLSSKCLSRFTLQDDTFISYIVQIFEKLFAKM